MREHLERWAWCASAKGAVVLGASRRVVQCGHAYTKVEFAYLH